MLIENELIFQIELIALENPDGFTYDLRTNQIVTKGIVVAFEETQNSYGRSGLHECIEHALYNNGCVGGWKNGQGQLQYDSVRIFQDLRKAIKWGRKQKQIAIFDLDNGWEIVL